MIESKTDKGHIVIALKKEEYRLIWEDTPGICDDCTKPLKDAYYLPVLNWLMCEECLAEWVERASYYAEDAPTEKKRYDRFKENAQILDIN